MGVDSTQLTRTLLVTGRASMYRGHVVVDKDKVKKN